VTDGRDWKIFVGQGLHAYFKQPTGPSRSGADWIVDLSPPEGSAAPYRVVVRVYDQDVAGQAVGDLIVQFLRDLIDSGWSPADYRGVPGELTYQPVL
jgi:hypothetical protein